MANLNFQITALWEVKLGKILEPLRKKGNALFNDTLSTFYLRIYGIGHMVKDHSDSEKGKLKLPLHVLFPISIIIPQTGLHIPQPLDTSCGALAGMRNSLMGLP